MAYRSSSVIGYTGSTATVLAVPTGAAVGDIAIADLFVEWSSGTVTPPTGFTLDASVAKTGSPAWIHYRFWKRLTGADTGTYTFNLSTTAASMGACDLYTGRIDTGSPLDTGTGATTTGTVAAGACPPLTRTPNVGSVDLHWCGFTYNNGAASAPAGFTGGITSADGISTAYRLDQPASSTGSVAAATPGSDDWTVQLSVLLPAGGGAAAPVPPPVIVTRPAITRAAYY